MILTGTKVKGRAAVRYDRTMPPRERIAVVGAGIIGCAVAFELSGRGASVTVYDGRSIAGGATQASAGILAPYTEAHEGGALFDLTVRSFDLYDKFVARVRERSRIDFEYRRAGTLEVAASDARCAELQSRLSQPWAGEARLEWVDSARLRAEVPSIARAALGALYCPRHAHVAVEAFTAAIADAARTGGANLEVRAAVQRIELLTESVRIHSSGRRESFDRVILCAGAWTPLLDPTGRTLQRIRPVRGQLVKLMAPDLMLPAILWSDDCYIVPWLGGTLLVGATAEDVGFDERPTASGVGQMLGGAQDLVPELASAAFVEVRVGLRPEATLGLPLLGPSSDPRVIFAAGHFRNGILLAPLTAHLIANYVLDDTIDPVFSAA